VAQVSRWEERVSARGNVIMDVYICVRIAGDLTTGIDSLRLRSCISSSSHISLILVDIATT